MELGVTAVMLPELDFDEQIALCRAEGVKYYQYRPRVIRPEQRDKPYHSHGRHKFDLTPDRLLTEGAALTARLRSAGLEPWGTVPALSVEADDETIKRDLEGAAVAEARCIRVSPPRYPSQPFDYEELLKRTIDRYGVVIEKYAAPLGLRVIIETHRGSLATSPGLALNLCRPFPPERIGVIFDMANFTGEGEINPVLAVSVLRDYIDCVHIGGGRRAIAGEDALGCKKMAMQWASLPDSDLHVPTWLRALRDAEVDPPLIIEDFSVEMTGARRLTRCARFLHEVLKSLEE